MQMDLDRIASDASNREHFTFLGERAELIEGLGMVQEDMLGVGRIGEEDEESSESGEDGGRRTMGFYKQ